MNKRSFAEANFPVAAIPIVTDPIGQNQSVRSGFFRPMATCSSYRRNGQQYVASLLFILSELFTMPLRAVLGISGYLGHLGAFVGGQIGGAPDIVVHENN